MNSAELDLRLVARLFTPVMVSLALLSSACGSKDKGAQQKFLSELPVRAAGLYALAPSSRSGPIRAHAYAVVTADSQTLAALPNQGKRVFNGPFPGSTSPPHALRDAVATVRQAVGIADDVRDALLEPAEAESLRVRLAKHRPAAPDGSGEEALAEPDDELPGDMMATDISGGRMGTGRRMPMEEGKIEASEPTSADLPRWEPALEAPLLLADANLPARRLLEVVTTLCQVGARIGVQGEGDRVAEHQVVLADRSGGRCAVEDPRGKGGLVMVEEPALLPGAANELSRARLGVGVTAAGLHLVAFDGNRPLLSAHVADGQALGKALAEVLGDDGEAYELWLRVEPDATVANLVAALDGASPHFTVAFVDGGVADWQENFLGAYNAAAWKAHLEMLYSPHATLGQVESSGDLDVDKIRLYIARKLLRVGLCYERELEKHPGLGGVASASFYISPTGAVLDSHGRAPTRALGECISDVMRSIQFPKPRGGGLVRVRPSFTLARVRRH